MSQPLCYTKPLTLEDRLLIELVTTRFEGRDDAWIAFDRGDHVELRCPENLRLSPSRLEQLKAQQSRVANETIEGEKAGTLRLSNGAGNGNS